LEPQQLSLVVTGKDHREPVPFAIDEASPEWSPEEFFAAIKNDERRAIYKRFPYSMVVWGAHDEPVWHTPYGRARLRPSLVRKIVSLVKRFNAQPAETRDENALQAEVTALIASYYAKPANDNAELPTALKLAPSLARRLMDFPDGGESDEMLMIGDVESRLRAIDNTSAQRSQSKATRGKAPSQPTIKPYVPKSRAGTTLLGVHLPDDLAEDFKLIARLQNTTAAQILSTYVKQYVDDHKSPHKIAKTLQSHVRTLGGNRSTEVARTVKSLGKLKR
jgi:hypothetical protein